MSIGKRSSNTKNINPTHEEDISVVFAVRTLNLKTHMSTKKRAE